MKVLIAGTNFKSKNHLKSQGQFLFDILIKSGIPCHITSSFNNFFLRTLDTLFTVLHYKRNDILILQVYSTKSLYLSYLTAVIGRIKGLKIISTLHGGNLPLEYKTNTTKRKMLNTIFSFSHTITAPSNFTQTEIEALANNPKFKMVKNLIQLEQYHVTNKNINGIAIFWMRAYHPNHNPLLAIDIVQQLKSIGQNVTLVMAGKDYGLKSKVIEKVSTLKLQDIVDIKDVINNEEKNKIAQQCNVYLCTNSVDNAPVTFLEMMAMGLPIVSTNVGGIPYYVENGKTAILSKNNSKEDLAQSLINMINNNEMYETLVKNGIENCQLYSENNISKVWNNLLQEVSNN